MLYVVHRTGAYLLDMVPGVLLALALFISLIPMRRRRLRRLRMAGGRGREALLLLFWMYCGGMAMLTLTPPSFHWLDALRRGYSTRFFQRGTANFVPFQTLGESLYILIGNVVMFLPFGLLAALLWRGFTGRRASMTGLAITGFIECWQYFAVGRSFDIDDLMFNTLGVLCGFWLLRLLERLAPSACAACRCVDLGRRTET